MYSIAVFSWNTESIPLSDTDGIDGNYPDFFMKWISIIEEQDPDVIAIGFQEDRHPGSYYHSNFLPSEMSKYGYSLVKRTKMMGVGVTTAKGLLDGDLFARGLRLSIYAKHKLADDIAYQEITMRKVIGNDGQREYTYNPFTRAKGAVASYLILPKVGRIAFICCHLPFNSNSLITEREQGNSMLRQNALNDANVCFNGIIEQLVLNQDPKPDHVIYFGDFNYRIHDYRKASIVSKLLLSGDEKIYSEFYTHDEMLEQMLKENIYMYKEGIDGNGPNFAPTCKMEKNRSVYSIIPEDNKIIWNVGRKQQRIPSWCDRILYSDEVKCLNYDRFDVGNAMSLSDHAAVIGLFQV